MLTIVNCGFGPHQVITKRVQFVKMLSHSIGLPEQSGIRTTQSVGKVHVNLGLGYLVPDKPTR